MNKLKIRTKLLISFVFMAIISGLVGLIGYNGMHVIQKAQDDQALVYLPSSLHLMEIAEFQTDIKAQELGLMVRRLQGADRQHFYSKIEKLLTK